jgi:hypothetical protein
MPFVMVSVLVASFSKPSLRCTGWAVRSALLPLRLADAVRDPLRVHREARAVPNGTVFVVVPPICVMRNFLSPPTLVIRGEPLPVRRQATEADPGETDSSWS